MDGYRQQDRGQDRAAIDAGATHDKVRSLDPAAAAMETDSETGGAPAPADARPDPVPEALSRGAASRGDTGRGNTPRPPAANPAGAGNGPSPTSRFTLGQTYRLILLGSILVLVIALLAWLWD